MKAKRLTTEKKVAVIGGGWYGSHTSWELASEGYVTTLFEKNSGLFSEISGEFGIRLHTGGHYPRSKPTRDSCVRGYMSFAADYSELIVPHEFSVYGVGTTDADGEPSKVSAEAFVDMCQKELDCREILYREDIDQQGEYSNLEALVKLPEPSIRVGRSLHEFFEKKLLDIGVNIVYDCSIWSVRRLNSGKIRLTSSNGKQTDFDHVINATSFKALLPNPRQLKLPFEVWYQSCIALVYEDKQPSSGKPFSFIVMDGWFPCLMPVVEYTTENSPLSREKAPQRYILTHGKWTILGSYDNPTGAQKRLNQLSEPSSTKVEKEIKPRCEKEMTRFFPSFSERFTYVKWIGAVLAKTKSNSEFRGSITFEDTKSGMIYIIPGKVSNIFDAAKETKTLIENKSGTTEEISGCRYAKDGLLDIALPYYKEPITLRNTCELNPFRQPTKLKSFPSSNSIILGGFVSTIIATFLNEYLPEEPNQSVKSLAAITFFILAFSLIANNCRKLPAFTKVSPFKPRSNKKTASKDYMLEIEPFIHEARL